jgi:diguanylate cyclase (GGDEF)-like protein
MTTPKIAVVGSDAELLRALRSARPELEIVDTFDEAVTVCIGEASALPAEGKMLHCTIEVSDEPHGREDRRAGALRLSRNSFLADAGGILDLAVDYAATKAELILASELAQFASRIDELLELGDESLVFDRVLRTAGGLVGATSGRLLLAEHGSDQFVGVAGEAPASRSEQLGSGLVPGIAAARLEEALVADRGMSLSPSTIPGKGSLIVPLRREDDLLGVFELMVEGDGPSEGALDALERYIDQSSPFLLRLHEWSQSTKLAMRDDLTRAYNRRFFESYLDDEIERSRRYGSLLSIIFLDLDDLKQVNSRYGHLSGSRMLQEVARRILGAVRNVDRVVRFGGDEFCVILPQTEPQQASAVAARIQRAMAERPFTLDQELDVPMTASFGIASFPIHASTKEELIQRADAAMFTVKTSTKNAIAVAEQPPQKQPDESRVTI